MVADECIQLHGGMGFMTVCLSIEFSHSSSHTHTHTGVWFRACHERSQNIPYI